MLPKDLNLNHPTVLALVCNDCAEDCHAGAWCVTQSTPGVSAG
jgi:hypothetical protein